MDPIVIEFVGAVLAGSMIALMLVLRLRYPTASPKIVPMLAIQRPRSSAQTRHRKTTRQLKSRAAMASSGTRRRPKVKKTETTIEAIVPQGESAGTTMTLDACPSCGLQAPSSLLAEHFSGSPSHKNGPPKVAEPEAVKAEILQESEEEISRQSVRNLMQILVPPRAFGRRHAHRTVSPISPVIR